MILRRSTSSNVFNAGFRVPEFEDKPDGQHIGPERQLSSPPHNSGKAWILWVTLLVIVAVVAYYLLHNRSAANSGGVFFQP